MSVLPRGWKSVPIANVCQVNPRDPGPADHSALVSFIPMPAVSDVDGVVMSHDTRPFAGVAKGYTRFREHDIIFAKITPCMENGKIAVASGLHGGFACGSTEFHVLRANEEVLPAYLWRFLRQESFRKDAERHMTGAVGQRRVPAQYIKDSEIPLPTLPVQRRIIANLNGLLKRSNTARAELARIPFLVERYKSAVLAAAFRGDLTAQWREEHSKSSWSIGDQQAIKERREAYIAGRRGSRLRDAPRLRTDGTVNLPRSWMSGCVADVADLRTGYAFKSAWFSTKGPRLLRGANIAPGKVVWGDTKRLAAEQVPLFEKGFRLSAGDIVIAMDRPVISGGLKVAVLTDEDEGAFLVQRVASPICSQLVIPEFLWFLINSRIFIEHVERHATGSDLPHISSNDILTTPLPLPPVQEQREIARRVEKLHTSVSIQLAEVLHASALLERLDQATLTRAFRGELV